MSGLNGQHSGRAGMLSGVAAAIAGMTVNWASSPGNLLPPGFSLTRAATSPASPGTYFDSTGLLQTAAVNFCTYSEDFSNGVWLSGSGGGATCTTTPNYGGVAAPDGTLTACRVQLNLNGLTGPGDECGLLHSLVFASYSGDVTHQVWMRTTDGTSGKVIYFGDADYSTPFTTVPTDWQLVTLTFSGSGSVGRFYVQLRGNNRPTVSDTADILIWHPQTEKASSATTYITTTTVANAAPRGTYRYNGSAWVFDGTMIEQAATNLGIRSNEYSTWTDVATPTVTQNLTGPDGTTSGWTFTDDSAVNIEYKTRNTVLTAATHTESVFVAKTSGAQSSYPVLFLIEGTRVAVCTIDTSNGVATAWTAYTGLTVQTSSARITDCGSWWRVELTFLATGATWSRGLIPAGTTNATQSTGALSATVTGSAGFFGSQIELGSAATSYIATGAASATRAADIVTATTSGLLVNGQGFAAMKFRTIAGSGSNANLSGADGGGGEGQPIASSAINASIYDGTNVQSVNTTNAQTPGAICTLASAWGPSIFRIAADGVVGANFPGWAGSMGFCPTLRIGDNPTLGAQPISMVLQSMRLGVQTVNNSRLANPFA